MTMDKTPLISVIVPAYNVAAYLNDCVESILGQSYGNIELILVDDGSDRDNTAELCDSWAEKDGRVRVVHKPNGGISSARNRGINVARGEYFMMVDSDDYLFDDTVVRKLYDEISRNGCDVVTGRMVRSDTMCGQGGDVAEEFVGTPLDSYPFFRNVIGFSYTSVPALYRRESVHCRFDETLRYFEDGDFLFHLYTVNLRCSHIPDKVYVYRKHPDSLTTSVNPRTIDDFRKVAVRVGEYAGDCYSSQMSEYYLQCSVMLYFWTLDKLCDRRYYHDRMKYVRQYDMESFRRATLKRMLQLRQFNRSIIYAALPLRLATLIHPIKD